MFMSSFFQGISIDETNSYYLCYFTFALYVLYYFNVFSIFKKYFAKFGESLNNGSFVHKTEVHTVEEIVLVTHPEYFEIEKPIWIYDGTYRTEVNGINKMKTDAKLRDGRYMINVNDKLKYIFKYKNIRRW